MAVGCAYPSGGDTMNVERREPDQMHRETVRLVREVHELEYQQMHPDIKNILSALCGPDDPLTGLPNGQGINGKIDRMELEQAEIGIRVTDLHENGKVKFGKWAKVFGGATVTGLFAILYLLLEHVLSGG